MERNAKPETTIESPCRKICRLEPITNMCVGCYRTRREIAQWVFYSSEERRAIIAQLPSRKHLLKHTIDPKQ
ncbi:MAG: DUF1289 domain-containing protein [Bacteroidota bacterium]|nr:DUF1289 domain-containing protein [Candidatus Kapabacteria bacterium]MCS7302036.1 DUF1289 domain-containing protein [Candidatus Kapabacteria bacterium]MCX7936836.1 DUF1289 domain-containing protein [Chlorobiota bacterium]MDW8074555.1 DUF1289 domain-containing protein [Bacteroidota bacterium]MDW8270969.1 DUF1289 domain-containing protein [Bacteroidota bacterium]